MSRRIFIGGLVLVALLVVSLYRAKYATRESEREIARVEREIQAAEIQQELLRSELSHLSSKDWIEEYARTELGMVPVKAEQFIDESDLDQRIGMAEAVPSQEVPQ